MAKHTPQNIRTIALVGHSSTGKTSLVEAALFSAGATTRMGRVDNGAAKTDYDPEEIKRKISINSIPATLDWKGTEVHVIDCPGFPDFYPEVRGLLDDVDGAVLMVSAQAGVEAMSEIAWEDLTERKLPTLVVVNRLDQENAEFDKVVGELGKTLKGRRLAPLLLPLGAAANFAGVIDIVQDRAYRYEKESGKFSETPVPDDVRDGVDSYREALIEAAAEADDALTEKYLEEGTLGPDDLVAGLRKGISQGTLCPVVAASADKAIGVAHLLEILVAYIPPASERVATGKKPDSDEVIEVKASDPAFSAHVFKVVVEPHVGELVFLRVYSGSVKGGDTVQNGTTGEKEKIGQIFKIVGKDRSDAHDLVPGEVGAMVKLKNTRLGHTLCTESRPVVFPPIEYPEPTMAMAIKPISQSDQEKLSGALNRMAVEDPGVHSRLDPITHEFVVTCNGDTQLDIFFCRLRDKYGVHVERAKPRIPYHETVRGKAEAEGKLKKQSGGRGQFAVANLRVEPMPTGGGFEFVDAIVGGVVPRQFIPAVEKGLRESLPRGILAGYPVTDVKVTLFFGKYHDVDSSEMAFKTAASLGFKEAARAARPVLLEPIMNVRIVVPENVTGDLIGDLNSRRGKIQGMDPLGSKTRIRALVPLAELHNYLATLRAITGGRVEYGLDQSHYEEVPANLAQGIIAAAAAHKKEEDED